MKADAVGLYVHIPFCVRKCNYCDFCSFPEGSFTGREEYIERLCREIASYKDKAITVDTVFFGGGTPSLLSREEFEKIVAHIKSSFKITDSCEFTLEANPGTLTRDKLLAYISLGVNRISLGLQSIHENELKFLGRIHTFEDFLEVYRLVRECGISNVNVDLMYGIPEQTLDSFLQTLRTVTALSPEHLSVYGLILEDGTPLYQLHESLPIPTEDTECDMYYAAARLLSECGYSHYEISNYARHGYECRHNLKYWRCEEYIGVGLSAYSYFGGKRFGNPRDRGEYIAALRGYSEKADEPYEYVMLALRLAEGFSLEDYKARFGADFLCGREKIIKQLEDAEYVKRQNGRLLLTEKGFYVSNYILTELL